MNKKHIVDTSFTVANASSQDIERIMESKDQVFDEDIQKQYQVFRRIRMEYSAAKAKL